MSLFQGNLCFVAVSEFLLVGTSDRSRGEVIAFRN